MKKLYIDKQHILTVVLSILLLCILIIIDELFDLPFIIFGVTPTPFNFAEIIIEISVILVLLLILLIIVNKSQNMRIKAEENLRDHEEIYRTIFENTGTATVILEEDTIISLANDKFAELSGYSRREIEGLKSWTEFVIPEDLKRMTEQHNLRRRNRDSALKSYEFVFEDRNNELKNILLNIDLIPGTSRSVASLLDITDRKQTEKKTEHLNLVIRMMRKVNQIITKEKDRNKLLKSVCDNLVQMLGFYTAWIALYNSGKFITHSESGFGEAFLPMLKKLEKSELTECMRCVSETDCIKVTENPLAECRDCPLTGQYSDRSALTAKMEFEGKVYGFISILAEKNIAMAKEEQKLFLEIADDIAFALHNLEFENKLKESEEKFRILAETSPMAIMLYRENKWIYANHAAEIICGYSLSELKNMYFWDIVAPEYQELVKGRGKERQKGLQPGTNYEFQIITKSGQRKWVLLNGNTIILEGIFTGIITVLDITCRKSAEEQLRESEERFRTAFESAKDCISIWDRKYNYLYANQSAIEHVGTTRDKVIGKNIHEALEHIPDFMHLWMNRIDKVFDTGEHMTFQDETILLGKRYFTDSVVTPIRNPDGSIYAVCVVYRDITERKQAEADKARLEEQIHQTQKLESIGRLAGGVAHDLNNLLSPIIGYGEMILENTGSDVNNRESVKEIVEAGMRARDLVRQLLAFGRKQTLEFKHIDLNVLLSKFEKLLRRTIREDITIKLVPARNLPLIRGDSGQLEQVIMNLAINAQDAMPDGGELIVETALVELSESYLVNNEKITPGSYVMLVVSDTGCGMKSDIIEHLFEPFFTTKAEGEGTGLGLPTVFGIVKQHGGSIGISSEPGTGTSFNIYLPVSTEDPYSDTNAGTETVSGLNGSETILLVEDNRQVRNLTHDILQHRGYTVLVAESGREAIDMLDLYEKPLHLILTDVVMPEMNGIQLFERISESYPDAKVLFMSGYTENVIAHHGILDKGVHFIQKPFSIQALAAKVREVLDQ